MPKPRALRVLHVITGSEIGGAQRHVEFLAQLLPAHGVSPEVACRPGGPLVSRVRELGAAVWEVPGLARGLLPWEDFRALNYLVRLLRWGRYDLVHCHSSKAGAIGRIAAALVGKPSIFTAHGFVFNSGRLPAWQRAAYAAIERGLSALSDAIITVSEADRTTAIRVGISAAKLHVIPNGVPVAQVSAPRPPAEPARASVGLAVEDHVVGTVTRLVPDKDMATWLRSAAIVASSDPRARFLIVGDGPQRDMLHGLARALGISDHVRWAGLQEDVAPFLACMDVFVLSSRKEGMPFALLEAMAARVPVVATAVGGIPEVVGTCGELVPPGTPQLLAAAILRLLADGNRPRIAASARARVLERFDIGQTVAATARLYRAVLSKRGVKSA